MSPAVPDATGVPTPQSLTQALRCAWQGLRLAWRGERQLRRHAWVALVVIASTVLLQLPMPQLALLLLTIALVLTLELVNTALERVVDLASPQWHALARDAKDIAAGAVLLASIAAALIGILILGPALLQHWHGVEPWH